MELDVAIRIMMRKYPNRMRECTKKSNRIERFRALSSLPEVTDFNQQLDTVVKVEDDGTYKTIKKADIMTNVEQEGLMYNDFGLNASGNAYTVLSTLGGRILGKVGDKLYELHATDAQYVVSHYSAAFSILTSMLFLTKHVMHQFKQYVFYAKEIRDKNESNVEKEDRKRFTPIIKKRIQQLQEDQSDNADASSKAPSTTSSSDTSSKPPSSSKTAFTSTSSSARSSKKKQKKKGGRKNEEEEEEEEEEALSWFQKKYRSNVQFNMQRRVQGHFRDTYGVYLPVSDVPEVLGISLANMKTTTELRFKEGMSWDTWLLKKGAIQAVAGVVMIYTYRFSNFA